ncbi:hypothetical protein SsS58_07997 [Streptomyces scabiei]|uniref:Uncharacterized protein n=1 Tax=Streptomyces scabiei TaxID=1930 RepID=A0A100JXK6_STRSC|nr:hypothetical protein SsS58_07997 [Streptomyces scabiei]
MGLGGGALGPGEELVPGPEQGAFAFHQQRQRLGGGDQLPQGMTGQDLVHLRRQRRRQPGGHGPRGVPQRVHGGEQNAPSAPALGDAVGGALVQPRTLLQDEFGVDAGRDLDAGVMPPGGDRITPALHGVRPDTLARYGDGGAPAVRAGGQFTHRGPVGRTALRVPEHHVRGDRVVALPDDDGRDLEGLAHDGLGRTATVVNGRPHIDDRYAADGGGARSPGGLRGWCGRRGRARVRRACGACGGALGSGVGGTGRRGW